MALARMDQIRCHCQIRSNQIIHLIFNYRPLQINHESWPQLVSLGSGGLVTSSIKSKGSFSCALALEIIFINQQTFHLSNLTFPKCFTNNSMQCSVTSIDCHTSIQTVYCRDEIFKFNQNNIK